MHRPTAAEQLEATAVLAERVRRILYLHVARQPHDVSRDAAAAAVGIKRSLAAFHLDKLVEAGLLEATYRRLGGRAGPGAGRPSKLYRRSARDIEINLPERQYQLLARLLAGAIGANPAASSALSRAARELGEGIGAEARPAAGSRPSRERLIRSTEATLEGLGFQPYRKATQEIRLRNCPFDAVARDQRDLVCRMNLKLIEGLLAGLRAMGIKASLEPTAGMCCVALRARARA